VEATAGYAVLDRTPTEAEGVELLHRDDSV